jgi:hypothetical protein
MTIVATEDTRNREWTNNNVGSALLKKMGWQEGEGIGKRTKSNTTALRALKRQAGLGLGAKMNSEGGQSESSNHFSDVLANLQSHHQQSIPSKKSSKKNKNKNQLTLPQNKVTAGHAQKMRQAKFGVKSAEEMACVFGNRDTFVEIKASNNSTEDDRNEKKRSRDSDDDKSREKKEKKRRKKEKKEAKKKQTAPSP